MLLLETTPNSKEKNSLSTEPKPELDNPEKKELLEKTLEIPPEKVEDPESTKEMIKDNSPELNNPELMSLEKSLILFSSET